MFKNKIQLLHNLYEFTIALSYTHDEQDLYHRWMHIESARQGIQNKALKKTTGCIAIDLYNSETRELTYFKAFSKYPKVFNQTYIAVVEAGEKSLCLHDYLQRLAAFIEIHTRRKQQLINQFVFLLLSLFSTILIVFTTIVYVVPQIKLAFVKEAISIPYAIAAIPFITKLSWCFSIIFVSFFVIRYAFSYSQKGQMLFFHFILKLPLIGKVVNDSVVSYITHSFQILLSCNIPVAQIFEIIEKSVDKRTFTFCIVNQIKKTFIKECDIAESFACSGIFDDVILNIMVKQSQQTGSLNKAFAQINNYYDFKIDNAIARLSLALKLASLLLIAFSILFVILTTIQPITYLI